jgi:hypothetical protein
MLNPVEEIKVILFRLSLMLGLEFSDIILIPVLTFRDFVRSVSKPGWKIVYLKESIIRGYVISVMQYIFKTILKAKLENKICNLLLRPTPTKTKFGNFYEYLYNLSIFEMVVE